MARNVGTAVFRATPSAGSVKKVAGKMSKLAKSLRSEMIAELRQIEPELSDVFSQAAPYDHDERDEFHLAEHINATIATAGQVRLSVYATARSPRSGFDYLDVTRFGHRGPLVARKGAMLRWKDSGGWHAAHTTAGHHPASDWVTDARPEAERVIDKATERLGRAIATRVL